MGFPYRAKIRCRGNVIKEAVVFAKYPDSRHENTHRLICSPEEWAKPRAAGELPEFYLGWPLKDILEEEEPRP